MVKQFLKNVKKCASGNHKSKGFTKIKTTSKAQKINRKVISKKKYLGRNFFFRKAMLEVKNFLKESQYKVIVTEKEGILYYTGRIL